MKTCPLHCTYFTHSLYPVIITWLHAFTELFYSFCGDGINNFGSSGEQMASANTVDIQFNSDNTDGTRSGIRIKFEAIVSYLFCVR